MRDFSNLNRTTINAKLFHHTRKKRNVICNAKLILFFSHNTLINNKNFIGSPATRGKGKMYGSFYCCLNISRNFQIEKIWVGNTALEVFVFCLKQEKNDSLLMRDSYKKGAKGNIKKGERRNWIVLDIKQRGEELGQIAIKKENLGKGVLL